MSDSVLMIARLTSLPGVMDVRRRFSICLSLEKERSALQLVTIKTKYIISTIATLGKVSCTLLSIAVVVACISAPRHIRSVRRSLFRGFRVYPYPRVNPTRPVTRGWGRVVIVTGRVRSGKIFYGYGYTRFYPRVSVVNLSQSVVSIVFRINFSFTQRRSLLERRHPLEDSFIML